MISGANDGSVSRSCPPRLTYAAMLMLLAGCQAASAPAPQIAAPTSKMPVKAKETAMRPHRASPQHNAAPPALPEQAAAPATPKESAAGLPSASLPSASLPSVSLIGLTPDQLDKLLGSPVTKEQQGLGRRWVYRSGDCTLSVSLYANIDTREFRSLSYEVSGDDHSEQGERLCRAQLAHQFGDAKSQ